MEKSVRFLTTLEVARALGVDRARVVALVRSGVLPAVKWDRRWRIPASALDRLESRAYRGLEKRREGGEEER